jgi:4-hydroxy-2-oxoheptanedioate aldolase
MENGRKFSAALKCGDYVYGTAILSASPVWPEILASLGMDFVFIDTEHNPLNRETVSWMCRAFHSMNIAPLVRIPSPDPYQATMALDGGAVGIVAPYIETAEQVRQLAGAVKYRPLKGSRLQQLLNDKNTVEPGLAGYLYRGNSENVLIANIESVPAIEALDDILSVAGLDAVLIGPNDLSCSLGIPEQYHHPLFEQSVEDIITRARAANIGAGVIGFYPDILPQEISWARKGANIVMHSNDIMAFKTMMNLDLQVIKTALEPD